MGSSLESENGQKQHLGELRFSRRRMLKLMLGMGVGLWSGMGVIEEVEAGEDDNERVDPREYGGGEVEINYQPFLEVENGVCVVSVNINDGTSVVWRVESGRAERLFETQVLVGRRLRIVEGLGEKFEESRFGHMGRYDEERGFYFPETGVVQHSLTKPMMAQVVGLLERVGFAGDSDTGTEIAVLQALRQGGIDGGHCNITLHETPHAPDYESRDVWLKQGWVEDPFDTGGCVNFSRTDFDIVSRWLGEALNKKMGVYVVFSYPGVNQELLLLGPDESMIDDPFDGIRGNDGWYWG